MDHGLALNVFSSGAEADDALKPSDKEREAIIKYAAEIQVSQSVAGHIEYHAEEAFLTHLCMCRMGNMQETVDTFNHLPALSKTRSMPTSTSVHATMYPRLIPAGSFASRPYMIR